MEVIYASLERNGFAATIAILLTIYLTQTVSGAIKETREDVKRLSERIDRFNEQMIAQTFYLSQLAHVGGIAVPSPLAELDKEAEKEKKI